MTEQSIYIGNKQATFNDQEIKGELITLDNEVYYKISNSDQMRPFFMSLISLYKNEYGNKVVFEEHNTDLGLTYRYQWSTSDAYGFVKKSTLVNHLDTPIKVTVLDGLQNIIPYSVGEDLQKASSNLVDAYKRNELITDSGVGMYALSATIVDKAEPSEALKNRS